MATHWRYRPRRSLTRRLVIVPVVALMVLILGTSEASAHYVYNKQWVYQSRNGCVTSRAEISHGTLGGGYSKADTESIRDGGFSYNGTAYHYSCFTNYPRKAGQIATGFILYRWNGYSWRACYTTRLYYNPSILTKWVVYEDYGRTPFCGAGYYATVSRSYVYTIDGQGFLGWQGGRVMASSHLLPA